MSDEDSGTTEAQNLIDQPYGDLMNAARSAREQFEEVEIETHAPTKEELVSAMQEYEFEGSRADGWTVEVDGSTEDVDLLDVQTPENQSSGSSGPSDATVLYCLTRAETTDERVAEIEAALEAETDYELRTAGSEGDKFSIVLPAEAQEGYEEEVEDEDDDEDDDEDEIDFGGVVRREVGTEATDEMLEGMAGEVEIEQNAESAHFIGREEDTGDERTVWAEFGLVGVEDDEDDDEAAEEAESEDEVEEDDDEADEEEIDESGDEQPEDEDEEEAVPADVLRNQLESRPKTGGGDEMSVYEIATDEDIEGRSNMTKPELIDAIIEARQEAGIVA